MNWDKKDIPPELVRDIATKYGCELLTASILARRGITDGEEVRFFLEDDQRHLRNPFLLSGMEDAVERIVAAKEEGEKVLVFGDRDVDGITSTTLLTETFIGMGMDTRWRVPVGDDPYGLSMAAVEEFAADYGTLIVTVDCGISNIAEIDRAAELGVDVIVVDHHNPPAELPRAVAIVNPKLADSKYPFRDLAGCGVAYKLASALRFARSELFKEDVCLLDARPANEAYVVEAVKIHNLVVVDRISETVVPGMVDIGKTRLVPFLEGQHILAWDAPLLKRTLTKVFGTGVEINMLDVASEIGKIIPSVAGKSLLRVKELSRIAKYADKAPSELDVFVNLFISFVHKKEGLSSPDDDQALQLVALGTLADLMPLRDENRILVRVGLAAMMAKPRPGL
ncbi:MAG: DHH family phosphoesterase, partial [Treponemataceae bacterium]